MTIQQWCYSCQKYIRGYGAWARHTSSKTHKAKAVKKKR